MTVQFLDIVAAPILRERSLDQIPSILAATRKGCDMNVADPRLQTVVNAKKLFEMLAKDCDSSKGEDRTAIELSSINESMCRLGAEVR